MSKQQSDQGQQSLRDRLMQLEAKGENEKAERNAVMEAFLRRRTDEYNRSTGENIVLSPPGDGPLRIINPPSGSIDQQNSDVNQDSLDGAQAFVSEVGSAEEFTEKKDNSNNTPSEDNKVDVSIYPSPMRLKRYRTPPGTPPRLPDHNGYESREAGDTKETGNSAQDVNGAEEENHHVNCKNGEANSTEFERRYLLEKEMENKKENPIVPPEELAEFYRSLKPIPPVRVSRTALERFKECNQENRDRGIREYYVIDEAASTVQHLDQNLDSDLDSLHGAQAQILVPFLGSPPRCTGTPPDTPPRPPHQVTLKSLSKVLTSTNASEKNNGDVPVHNGHESREAGDPKENGYSAHNANGAEEEDQHVNGKNGQAEVDSTQAGGVLAQKRKSIDENETQIRRPMSLKKTRIEGVEVTDAVDTSINCNFVETDVV